jgi:hypothetical protein
VRRLRPRSTRATRDVRAGLGGANSVDPDGRKLVSTPPMQSARRAQQKEMMKFMDLISNLALSRPMLSGAVWRKTREVLLEKAL